MQDGTVGGIVVDNKHAPTMQIGVWLLGSWRPGWLLAQACGEPECTPLTLDTLYANRPPHHVCQLLEIARPRPVPPYFRVVEVSACEKD